MEKYWPNAITAAKTISYLQSLNKYLLTFNHFFLPQRIINAQT